MAIKVTQEDLGADANPRSLEDCPLANALNRQPLQHGDRYGVFEDYIRVCRDNLWQDLADNGPLLKNWLARVDDSDTEYGIDRTVMPPPITVIIEDGLAEIVPRQPTLL